jgi:hypothetical protein
MTVSMPLVNTVASYERWHRQTSIPAWTTFTRWRSGAK